MAFLDLPTELLHTIIEELSGCPLYGPTIYSLVMTSRRLRVQFSTHLKRFIFGHPGGLPPLHAAASIGSTALLSPTRAMGGVTAFLSALSIISINHLDGNGSTALHIALNNGHTAFVRRLVTVTGINIDATDRHGQTPLRLAVVGLQVDMVDLLLSEGASAVSDETILHMACRRWTRDETAVDTAIAIIARLFAAGVDANRYNTIGQTALMDAIRCGNSTIVNYLLDNGADPTVLAGDGRTALHLAVNIGTVGIVRILLARTSVEHRNTKDTSKGGTLYHWAARRGILGERIEMYDLLAEFGVKEDECDSVGGRAVTWTQEPQRTFIYPSI